MPNRILVIIIAFFALLTMISLSPSTTASALSTTTTTTTTHTMASPRPSNKPRISWKVRPVSPDDKASLNRMLDASFSSLLPNDYDDDILSKSLPLLTSVRSDLLTCPTWYVVEHPSTKQIVGCGGWTAHSPKTEPDHLYGSQQPRKVTPHLRHFATDPAFARRGIGRAVWNRIWSDICDAFGPQSNLEVFSTLTAAPFYASLGFETVEGMEMSLTEDCQFPCVLMRRQAT